MIRSTNLILAVAIGAGALAAQDDRGLSIQNARILTMAGPEIPRGTVLVRNGKIEQVGADVATPAGYRVVDAQGGTLMPGCVSAFSHVGLGAAPVATEARPNQFRGRGARRGGRGGAPAASGDNKAGERVIDALYARQDVFGEMLRAGVTTIGLAPTGRGLAGQGAVIRPQGDSAEAMTIVPSAFQAIVPVTDTKTKDLLRKAFEDARREVEARKRRAAAPPAEATPPAQEGGAAEGNAAEKPKEGEAPPPAEGQPAREEGGGGRGGETGARPAAAPQPPDPAVEALADLLEGKARAFVSLDSANDVLHFADTAQGTTFPITVVARRHAQSMSEGSLELALAQLKAMKGTVLLAPDLATLPNTQQLVSIPRRLHAAGIEIGFLLPDGARAVDTLRAQLLELVRTGLPAATALAAVTVVPAKALGVDKALGSIATGKTANLLLWSHDPLDPEATLRSVWLEGKAVTEEQR